MNQIFLFLPVSYIFWIIWPDIMCKRIAEIEVDTMVILLWADKDHQCKIVRQSNLDFELNLDLVKFNSPLF